MKFLVFVVISFLVEVWSLRCWFADYEDCKKMQTLDKLYECAKEKESEFQRANCYEDECGLATGTFTDKSQIELRFCKSELDDCEFIKRIIKKYETKTKKLSKELQCSLCSAALCNDPKYEANSKNDSAKYEVKSKNGSGIQNYKFPKIFILVTIFLIILTAF